MKLNYVAVLLLVALTTNADWKVIGPKSKGVMYYSPEQAAQEAAHRQRLQDEFAAKIRADEQAKIDAARDAFNVKAAAIAAERDAKITALRGDKDEEIARITDDLRIAETALERTKYENEKKLFAPRDPYRLIDGKLTYAKGLGWHVFEGVVSEVQPEGICMIGTSGPPLEPHNPKRELFIADYPYPIADNEKTPAGEKLVALYDQKDPTYTYTNTFHTQKGGRHTVRKLKFGKIYETPSSDEIARLTPKESPLEDTVPLEQKVASLERKRAACLQSYNNQVAVTRDEYDRKLRDLPSVFAKAAKERADEKRKQQDVKVLAFHQQLADKGDPYGVYQMGRRYLTGDGVPMDAAKGKDLLARAAASGIPEAKELLQKPNTPTSATNSPASPAQPIEIKMMVP